jgi:hypothetical protein
MHNAIVMQVCNRFDNDSDKMGGITLEITTLLTDTVKQLSPKSKISHQVHYTGFGIISRNSCKVSKGGSTQAWIKTNMSLQLLRVSK